MSHDLERTYGPFRSSCAIPSGPVDTSIDCSVGEKYEPARIYGAAINVVAEDRDGRLWVFCDDEPQASQVNFCPYTGRRARVPMQGTDPAADLEQQLFAFLQRKYVQRADDRQREMGLTFMEAETHDLAREVVRFMTMPHR